MKKLPFLPLLLVLINTLFVQAQTFDTPEMYFGDTSRLGRPFSKDPHVVKFKGRYLMYYSIPGIPKSDTMSGWGVGIAESRDLTHWNRVGEIRPAGGPETKGLAAPAALVHQGKVHLFYQTYGNMAKDAICHAFSEDGIHFTRNPTNPIFHPTGNWTIGRAIDAEVVKTNDRFLLYFATRDTTFKIQKLGVAAAPLTTDFSRKDWTQLTDDAILEPKYAWEETCIEGASVIRKGDWYYMFYAGAYNNRPQQVGVARSKDGVSWERLSNKPFLTNGDPGTWNNSESGHPHIFEDENGRTYLFFQGNNDMGYTWFISKIEVLWNEKGPYLSDHK